MSKTIEVVVDPNGKTTVQTRSFAGPGCREASRVLAAALGARISKAVTAEFHQQSQPADQHLCQAE